MKYKEKKFFESILKKVEKYLRIKKISINTGKPY